MNSWMSSNDQSLTKFWKMNMLNWCIYFTAQQLSFVWRYIYHTSHIYLCTCTFNMYMPHNVYEQRITSFWHIHIMQKRLATLNHAEINIMYPTVQSRYILCVKTTRLKLLQCLWLALVPTNLASCVSISSTKRNDSWIIHGSYFQLTYIHPFQIREGQQLLHLHDLQLVRSLLSSSSMPSP